MAGIDRATIEERGVPSLVLMEHAGLAIVRVLDGEGRPGRVRAVHVVAGSGNNAGDGFVVARLLARQGHRVTVHTARDPERLQGDARANFEALRSVTATVTRVVDPAGLRQELAAADVVVDALLGTGTRGELEGPYRGIVEAMDASPGFKLAVDIPSGLCADSGRILGAALTADATVTMGLPKLGFYLGDGPTRVGRIHVADLGFPADLTGDPRVGPLLLTAAGVRDDLPPRWPDSHKYDYGRVLVVGGSAGMSGAPVLAARAAYRAGAGLVRMVAPRSIAPAQAAANPEILVQPVPETAAGALDAGAVETLAPLVESSDCLVLGPGLSRDPAALELVRRILERTRVPVVVDADALLAVTPGTLAGRPAVVTPHHGEAIRLLGDRITGDRCATLDRLVQTVGAHVVLKGPWTLIGSPEGAIRVNPSGNAGLAVGGSGDVLAGILGGLLAQSRAAETRRGLTPAMDRVLDLGVYLHGLGADLAARDRDVRSITPGDLIEAIGPAILHLRDLEPGSFSPSDRIQGA